MAEAGAAGIVFADRNEQGARAAAEESKRYAQNPNYRAIAVAVDVTDPSSVQEMANKTMNEFGRIDYSVNSAGVSKLINIGSLLITLHGNWRLPLYAIEFQD